MVDYDDDLYNLWHNMVQFPGSSFRPLCRCVLHKVLLLLHSTPLWHDAHLVCLLSSAQLRVKGRASRGVAERLCWAPGQSFRSVIIWCVYSEKSHRPSARRRVWCPTLFIVGIIRGRILWHDDGEDDGHPVLLLLGPIVCVVIRRQTCRSSVESCFM